MICVRASFGIDPDSLIESLDNATERGKIEIFNQLSEYYHTQKQSEKALQYAEEAYKLTNETPYNKEKAQSLLSMATAHIQLGNYQTAKELNEKAFKIFDGMNDIKEVAKVFNNFSSIYNRLKQYDKVEFFLNKELDIYKRLNDVDKIIKTYKNLGTLYLMLTDYEKSLDFYLKQINLVKKHKSELELADSYNNVAFLYDKWGKYNKALDYNIKQLVIYEGIGDSTKIASSKIDIGKIYFDLENYDKAVESYQSALDIYQKLGDSSHSARVYTNLGAVYYDMEEYQKALSYYQKSLQLVESTGAKKGKSILLNNIGLIYKKLGNYEKAMDYCKRSLELKEVMGNDQLKIYPLVSIGEIYMNTGNYSLAENYALQGLKLAQKVQKNYLIKDAYYLLYDINQSAGNYKKALDYHRSYAAIKDSILNEETSKRIAELQIKYETDKKVLENQQKTKENQILRNTNQRQLIYFIVISLLSIILIIVLLNRYRNKQKANTLLTQKNKQIVEQHKELENLVEKISKREEQLKDANQTKNKFFSIIAHDLRNPLHALLLSTDSLVRYRHKFTELQLEKTLFFIRKSVTHVNDLLESLLQWARTQTGRIQYNPETIDIDQIITENINLHFGQANKKNIVIENNIKESLSIYADQKMISTVVRNLISNAIKFTDVNGKVIIDGKQNGKYIEISVEDTGVGISEDNLSKLFRIDVHHSTVGTYDERGTGLGLVLCKEFVEKNDGEIRVESKVGEGSKFTVVLPKDPTEKETEPEKTL